MAKEKEAGLGCLIAVLALFIQLPLFCALIYAVLEASAAPTWAWAIFWAYVPVCFILGIFRAVAEALAKSD